jgi:hypothetical protein
VLGAAIGGMCRAVDEKSPLPGLGNLFRDAVHKIAGAFE